MLILPAIDISEGKCVRLTRGDFNAKKIYSDDPIEIARNFKAKGASMLHIVDLDGAKDGKPINMSLILKLCRDVKIPVQVGGGIRDLESVKMYLEGGVKRIILSTKAIEDVVFLKTIVDKFGSEKIVISLDVKNGEIMSNGWLTGRGGDLELLLLRIKSVGIERVIVTDVMADGTLTWPNFALMKRVLGLGLEVITAGGVSNIRDIDDLEGMGVKGVIIGKAIYEGAVDLEDLLGPSFLAKRIIPCLDVKDGRVVKGTNFLNLRDAGDAVELGKKYAIESADELVFLDITATKEARQTRLEMVRKVAEEIFIPFTVGGGVRSVEEIGELLNAGADKIAINSGAVKNPNLIREAAEKFGSQCVVVAVDVKKISGGWKVFVKGGSEETDLDCINWIKKVEALGAGEILLTSMDRDGTKKGFDLELLKGVSKVVDVPLIASGGAGCLEDFEMALTEGKADGVLAAGLFHYGKMRISSLKQFLQSKNLLIRI